VNFTSVDSLDASTLMEKFIRSAVLQLIIGHIHSQAKFVVLVSECIQKVEHSVSNLMRGSANVALKDTKEIERKRLLVSISQMSILSSYQSRPRTYKYHLNLC